MNLAFASRIQGQEFQGDCLIAKVDGLGKVDLL